MKRRRDFLQQGAYLLTAGSLQACASGLPRARRPAVGPALSPILRTLALGLNAPSPHNTQSWLFDVIDDHEALLRVDPTRLLPHTDPPARQIHIGCGCFLEACALGATTLGLAATIDVLPEGAYRVPEDVGRLPVARIRVAPSPAAAPHPLAASISKRRTSRLVYSGELVIEEAFAKVADDAAPEGSRLVPILGERMKPYLALFDKAMTIEFHTRATNEETRRWFRFTSEEAATTRDGLTFEANGVTGVGATFARWFVDDSAESWNSQDVLDEGLSRFREGLYSARGIAFLHTDRNEIPDQIAVGRDVYRFMLALTQHGLMCHPLTQVVQEYAAMTPARRAFEELSGISAPAKVQMILRFGHSEAPFKSFRRDLRSFL